MSSGPEIFQEGTAMSRRAWLLRAALYGTPCALYGYGRLVEKNWLTVTRRDIPLSARFSHLEGRKIVLMSDFHHDDYGSRQLIRRAVAAANAAAPDLVLLAGDFISKDTRYLSPLFEELGHLQAKQGVFAVLGNHDQKHYSPRIPRVMDEAGVRLLANDGVSLDDFSVAGLESQCVGRPDLEGTLRKLDRDKPILLGWHEPDPFQHVTDERVVLQLSGHTHGGQICAPFHGPLILPPHGRRYPYGHYQRGEAHLFVTRGIGTLKRPLRFFAPPELVILTLGKREGGGAGVAMG